MSQSGQSCKRYPGENDKSNLIKKSPPKPKLEALMRAMGLGKKGDDAEKRRLKAETKRINRELDQARLTHQLYLKQKKTDRKEEESLLVRDLWLTDFAIDREPWKAPRLKDYKGSVEVRRMEMRWKEEDRFAYRQMDETIKELDTQKRNLQSEKRGPVRLIEQDRKGNDYISTNEVAEDPVKEPEAPALSREARNALLKFRMMMEWEHEECKEWILGYFEEVHGKSRFEEEPLKSRLHYQADNMGDLSGKRMFEMTKFDWESYFSPAEGLIFSGWSVSKLDFEENEGHKSGHKQWFGKFKGSHEEVSWRR